MLGDAARLRVDVRADEADLHRRVGLEARRAAARPPGIAVVAPGPVAAEPAADLVAGVATALAQLVPERAELARSRRGTTRGGAVSPAAMAARRSAAVRPGNDVQPVPIASRAWASLLPSCGRPCASAKPHDAVDATAGRAPSG